VTSSNVLDIGATAGNAAFYAFVWPIITGDVRNETFQDSSHVPHNVDDIEINVSTGFIDGNGLPFFGNILAQTKINYVREKPTSRVLSVRVVFLEGAICLSDARKEGTGAAELMETAPAMTAVILLPANMPVSTHLARENEAPTSHYVGAAPT